MLALATIPTDVWLRILSECTLRDTLSIEATCKELRSISAIRHHWLTRLRNLSSACAPDLPRYVDLSSLSAAELRDMVVRSARSYRKFKTGSLGGDTSREIMARPEKCMMLFGPNTLVAGGRYIFVLLKNRDVQAEVREDIDISRYLSLELWDLTRDCRAIWSYCPDESSSEIAVDTLEYSFQSRSAGSIRLAVTTRLVLEVHDLVLNESGDCSASLLIQTRHRMRDGASLIPAIHDHFVVLTGNGATEILVVNLDENWVIRLIYSNEENDDFEENPYITVEDMHIFNGYIFVIFGHEDYREYTLCAIPCNALAAYVKDEPESFKLLSEVPHATFALDGDMPEGYEIEQVGSLGMSDSFWAGERNPFVFTAFARASEEHIHFFIAFQLEFDPSSNAFVLLRRSEPVPYPHFLQDHRGAEVTRIGIGATTRAGRALLDIASELHSDDGHEPVFQERKDEPANAFCVGLDEDGSVLFPSSPYLEKLFEDGYEVDMDSDSGALICVSKIGDHVRIIYP